MQGHDHQTWHGGSVHDAATLTLDFDSGTGRLFNLRRQAPSRKIT